MIGALGGNQGEPKSTWVLMFVGGDCHVGNSLSKSHEILMSVCLQKDAKQCCDVSKSQIMNSTKLVIPLHFISRKKTPNDAVTPLGQSQFTPKMKANAVPRLLSSLV